MSLKKVLFFGDSNTYGYDPAGFMGGRYPKASRWTTILQEKLADTWEISEDGLPGRSIPSSRYEWGYLAVLLDRAMPFDLFAVMLGSNDILGTLHPDAAKTAKKMEDLIFFVRDVTGQGVRNKTTAAAPQILLIAPPKIELTDQAYLEPYVSGDRSYAQMYYEEGQKLSQYYGELARRRETFFADSAQWDLSFAFDGVHLSEEGNAAFATQMADVLRDLTERLPQPPGQ